MPFCGNVPELLAPINSIISLKLAISSGADAVYFGKKFSARRSAENLQNLKEVTSICHLFGVKAYLTLNTAVKNDEIDDLKSLISEALDAKIDAFIVTDLTVVDIIKEFDPHAHIHASTQMGANNVLGAKFLSKRGFERIILAREVRLKDVNGIKEQTDCEIEIFVHGAMCVGFSGACLLSSMLTGNSGNRGACLQLCRRFYRGYFNGNCEKCGYLLSPKDISLKNDLSLIKNLPVSSVKIEGRLKRDEYIAGVTSVYRKALDGTDEKTSECVLKRLFNRGGFCNGYNNGNDGIIYPEIQNHIGEKIGKVLFVKKGVIVISSSHKLEKGDGLKLIDNGREVGGFSVESFEIINGKGYAVRTNCSASLGNDVCITTDKRLNEELVKSIPKFKIGAKIVVIPNKPLLLTFFYEDIYVVAEGNIVQAALNKALDEESIKKQISKLGDTFFELESFECICADGFIPLSELNSLRRKGVELLEKALIENYEKEMKPSSASREKIYEAEKIVGNFVEIRDLSQITRSVIENIDNIVFYPPILSDVICKEFFDRVKDKKTFLKLPVYAPSSVVAQLERVSVYFDGFLVNNYYGIEFAERLAKPYVLGPSLNVFNPHNPLVLSASNFIISVELNRREIATFEGKGLIYAYGKLPLMYLEHCPRKVLGKNCNNCSGSLEYRDEKCYNIVSEKYEGNCEHILKNPVNLDLINEIKGFDLYLDLTETTPEGVERLISDVASRAHVKDEASTNGHYKRGVK